MCVMWLAIKNDGGGLKAEKHNFKPDLSSLDWKTCEEFVLDNCIGTKSFKERERERWTENVFPFSYLSG